MRSALRLSIVLPALNEATGIAATLQALAPLRAVGHEVIVVDGGSTDGTAALAAPRASRVVESERGRARQMNAGAAVATGEVLLFLHADTRLPAGADAAITAALQRGARWGRFDVHIEGRSRWLPVVARLMNWRSRLTGIATGDQALFIETPLFRELGGYAPLPLMEDIELCTRLRAFGHPACLRERVTTSGRRWDSRGAWRTIWLMWTLRWRYWRGTPAEELARAYR
ncbi:TIGR04283 family arsenosugar biosynthesis glycosyltransferase [Rubrivivax rivuli]|uniref:Glycosyltransferase n=1 Tax=Rubrivivax rivuli TaxID=1862385 RepID=A0A437RR90_9BURK|nr:TIGR04283 family arsenosugar biosynthesis glycosyltransferase [Rubrivivax rivuli]RVU49307.1 glycosyltransferase [Rubrivivax rivuli]